MKKLSLLLVLLLVFAVMPSVAHAATVKKAVVAKKVVAKKVVAKKIVAKKVATKALSSATVKAAQKVLAKDGLYKGKVDGMNGAMTANAVKAFQKKKGLKVDGIIGPKTLKALGVK